MQANKKLSMSTKMNVNKNLLKNMKKKTMKTATKLKMNSKTKVNMHMNMKKVNMRTNMKLKMKTNVKINMKKIKMNANMKLKMNTNMHMNMNMKTNVNMNTRSHFRSRLFGANYFVRRRKVPLRLRCLPSCWCCWLVCCLSPWQMIFCTRLSARLARHQCRRP